MRVLVGRSFLLVLAVAFFSLLTAPSYDGNGADSITPPPGGRAAARVLGGLAAGTSLRVAHAHHPPWSCGGSCGWVVVAGHSARYRQAS